MESNISARYLGHENGMSARYQVHGIVVKMMSARYLVVEVVSLPDMGQISRTWNCSRGLLGCSRDKTAVLDTCAMPGRLCNRLSFQRPWVAFTRVFNLPALPWMPVDEFMSPTPGRDSNVSFFLCQIPARVTAICGMSSRDRSGYPADIWEPMTRGLPDGS